MSSMQHSQLPVEESEQTHQKSSEETRRHPLALSEKNNVVSRKPRTREIASRYKSPITFASPDTPAVPSSARRFPSPKTTRTDPVSTNSFPKRAQSAERRRPSTLSSLSGPFTPPNNSTLSNVSSEIQISSKRSLGRSQVRTLCVSFQTNTFSLPITRRERPFAQVSDHTLKPSANVARKQLETPAPQRKVTTPERKRTPKRGKNADQLENSQPLESSHSRVVDRCMRPSRSSGTTSSDSLNGSVDLTGKVNKSAALLLQGRGVAALTRTPTSDAVNRGLQKSMNEGPVGPARSNVVRRVSFDVGDVSEIGMVDGASLPASSKGNSHFTADRPSQIPCLSHDAGLCNSEGTPGEITSCTGSFSSSNNLLQEEIGSFHGSFTGGDSGRWKSMPAPSFRNRPVLCSSMSASDSSSAALVFPRQTKVVSSSSGVSSSSSSERALSTPRSSRSQSSPLRGLHHPPPPSKICVSPTPSRGMISPSKHRALAAAASSVTNSTGSSSSVLNFVADVRKGKKGANYIEEAHQLRILYNRYLQWRFINAQTDASLSIQQVTVEKLFYDVWRTTSVLHNSVTVKRIDLQQLRQSMKINLILKKQMPYLDDWPLLEREHVDSLSGAIEALKASILCVPVTGGARVNIQILRDVISSTVDVMQATDSSLCFLLSKGIYSTMPRGRDIAWEHMTSVDGSTSRVRCNYCHHEMSGGATRMKEHLLGKRGEVVPCLRIPRATQDHIRSEVGDKSKVKALAKARTSTQAHDDDAEARTSTQAHDDGRELEIVLQLSRQEAELQKRQTALEEEEMELAIQRSLQDPWRYGQGSSSRFSGGPIIRDPPSSSSRYQPYPYQTHSDSDSST